MRNLMTSDEQALLPENPMTGQPLKNGKPVDLKVRTKQFALRVIRLFNSLPKANLVANVVGRQLLRSGTSVGANYRAACRARSSRDFCAKMGLVEEEADESAYWMELLVEAGLVREELLGELLAEANELVAIVVASIKTARRSAQGGKHRGH
jgi:four helix bundle protein